METKDRQDGWSHFSCLFSPFLSFFIFNSLSSQWSKIDIFRGVNYRKGVVGVEFSFFFLFSQFFFLFFPFLSIFFPFSSFFFTIFFLFLPFFSEEKNPFSSFFSNFLIWYKDGLRIIYCLKILYLNFSISPQYSKSKNRFAELIQEHLQSAVLCDLSRCGERRLSKFYQGTNLYFGASFSIE